MAFALIETIGQLGVWFALINLLPVPPLTGSHLLTALAPAPASRCAGTGLCGIAPLGLAATGLVTACWRRSTACIARLVLGE